MSSKHHYNVIEEELDDAKAEPRYISRPTVVTSWWKLFLCNLLAAVVGAGAMFIFANGFMPPRSVDSTAATSAASTTTSSADHAHATLDIGPVLGQPESEVLLPGQKLDCGYSPEEARAKNCVYDVMMQDWVPKPCYDEALTKKYLAEGKWTWYADGDGNATISDEDMAKGEHGEAWMSSSYHKAHCVFSWLKIIRALRNNRGISQELLSYDHVLHCSHGALKEEASDIGLGVAAPTNYAICALYSTWLDDPLHDVHDSTQK